jgi:acyl-CoA synthetase (AMP-forming)/AMP-acid ligase II
VSRTNPFETAPANGLLAAVAARHGEREAIVLGDERVTFADFLTRVDTLAAGLTALGLGKGDSLAIWLPNRPGWFVAQYAAARLGIVVVALNPRYRPTSSATSSASRRPPRCSSPITWARSTTSRRCTR